MNRIAALTFALTLALASGFAASPAHAAAIIGKPAPPLELTDTSGETVRLDAFQGKVVVLEWVNFECPFVRKHYGSGNMQKLQKTYTGKDVVWITICSSAPGKQGHLKAAEANALVKEKNAAPTRFLLDPSGTVGKAYGAKTTPHMFVIDPEGMVVYNGALDDKPSTKQADIAKARNYVIAALDATLGGKPVKVSATQPYGCTVKY